MTVEWSSGGAVFSRCMRYRYVLTRRWSFDTGGVYFPPTLIAFIGLNPSTATEFEDDPTIRRLIQFAKREEVDGMIMLNLFAFRATDPRVMREQIEPEGMENRDHIVNVCRAVRRVVCCWGSHGNHRDQGNEILELLRRVMVSPSAFGLTKCGQPLHPLYLAADTPLANLSELKAGL